MRGFPPSSPEPAYGSPAFFAVLHKEAVYCAAGLASYELTNLGKSQSSQGQAAPFTFRQWYMGVLRHEMMNNQKGLCRELMRCRVVSLVEEFCGDVTEVKPALVHTLERFLKSKGMEL